MGFFHRPENPLDTFWHRTLGPTIGACVVFVLEVVQIVIISAAVIVPIRYFLIQPFYVKGASMEPNFYDREYLIIDELSYRFTEPERGDIIVFRYKHDRSEFFIKRVVGLPGETVEVTGGRVVIYTDDYVNGVVLEEEYLHDAATPAGKYNHVTLGAGEYYALGDNREASLDSRMFGPVEREDLVGRVWLRGLPLSRVGVFDAPEYAL
jgi:signal peptidase I